MRFTLVNIQVGGQGAMPMPPCSIVAGPFAHPLAVAPHERFHSGLVIDRVGAGVEVGVVGHVLPLLQTLLHGIFAILLLTNSECGSECEKNGVETGEPQTREIFPVVGCAGVRGRCLQTIRLHAGAAMRCQ